MNKTITLNSEEIEILSEILSEICGLDFPISDRPEFDTVWEKIIS